MNSRPKCAKKDCAFQCCVENRYCRKHAICLFLDEIKEQNKKRKGSNRQNEPRKRTV